MSREIKFKVWDSYKNKWLEDFVLLPNGEVLGMDKRMNVIFLISIGADRRYKKCQYTGLKDKNGKEIFEGYVVKTHNQNNVIKYEHGSLLVKGLHPDEYERTYSVLYHYLVDATIPDMPHSKFDGVTTTLEVIGNIYENPELLEETA